VGFGGRNLPGADGPKYKNSQESSIYAKSRILYGLNWAKTEIVEIDEVVVCEGYTDVIGFAQAGVGRAVATCGTALTEDHVRLLRRFARRVVLAFDADTAGQEAAARFYAWEQTHDLDVAVADLPPGVDPGDLAQSDPERLVKSVEAARPFLEFRVERALRAGSMDSVEARTRTADAALEMIAEHPNPLVRDEYAVTVASRCRLEVDNVRARLQHVGRGADRERVAAGSSTRAAAARSGRVAVREGPEVEALKLAIQNDPELPGLVVPELFDDELCASVYQLVITQDTLHAVIEAGGDEVGELVQRLSVEETQATALEVAARLWARFLERQVAQTSASVGELDRELMEQHTWLDRRRREVLDPAQQAGAIADLLVWMGEPAEDGR
jgi:DNA primase